MMLLDTSFNPLNVFRVLFYLWGFIICWITTSLSVGNLNIWKSFNAWLIRLPPDWNQAGAWSIRRLPDQDQASAWSISQPPKKNQVAAWLIRQLPDWNQAAAWTIRIPLCDKCKEVVDQRVAYALQTYIPRGGKGSGVYFLSECTFLTQFLL